MKTISALYAATVVMFLTSCGSDVSLPDDAKGTVESITNHLAENKPQVIWAALPESYQKDVNDVVRTAIGTIDGDVYDKAVGIINKANKVLTDKKEFILKNEHLGLFAKDLDEVSSNWDAFTDLVAILLESQLGTYGNAKNIDGGEFLADTGSELMDKLEIISSLAEEDKWQTEFVAKLKAVKVEEISVSGEQTILRVTGPDGQVEEGPWEKVEGKWIPKAMEMAWKPGIAEAKAQILKNTETLTNKLQVMAVLSMVESVLEQLNKAVTQKEFEAAIASISNFGG